MGTEYTLGKHDEVMTVNGQGIHLQAYEMSGLFDVYTDIPKDRVDLEAWEDCARVDLWKNVTPDELLKIGSRIIEIAKQELHKYDWHKDIVHWETVEYPKKWESAYSAGVLARENGLPRECNLGPEFKHNGVILKPWVSAWQCGYDGTFLPGC